MIVDENKLCEFLVGTGIVSRSQIDEINRQASNNPDGVIENLEGRDDLLQRTMSIADQLCSAGLLSRDDMCRAHAHVLGVPFVDLRGERIDPSVLTLIPEPVSRSHNIVSYRRVGDILEVAMLDMRDIRVLDFLREHLPKIKVAPRLASEQSLRSALIQYQQLLRNDLGDTIAREAGSLDFSPNEAASFEPEQLKKQAKVRSAMCAVDALLRHAMSQSATDIHFEPREKELMVRYRIGGRLYDAMTLPKTAISGIVLRLKSLANMILHERNTSQEGVFKVYDGSRWMSVHLATLPVVCGEKVIARLHRENQSGVSLEGLGFRSSAVEHLLNALSGKHGGMVVATGSYDAGAHATDSLYVMLEMLNTPSRSLGTIENRFLRQMPHVSQTIANGESGGFTDGLRALLRRDMDVIMAGNTDEEEMAKLAVNAALGDRIMLVKHEAPSAMEAVAKIRSLEVDPVSLASALRVVVGHCSVRRLHTTKKSYIPTHRELEVLYELANMNLVLDTLKEEKIVGSRATWRDIPFYRPTSSGECEDGYSGKLALQEVVPIDAAMKELIAYGATSEELASRARADGHLSLFEDGIFKAVQGITSLEEVLGVVQA